ncbi:hypothetical protein KU73_14135 [Pectobacterium wasabiae]|uniref:Uncharacterized protein n=1 Tax=Pectobacterium wasabiae TaxID=55208 RepID=A0AAW3EFV5_9GAMM|nr:hypothetical protein A7983_22480 [Pectobacterium wasabiae CFBP 3304]KFX04889.1 hypothetical protein JV38_14145 [Pectobacterium wasabiae]KGA27775.1 hypothetical protein KU73_14135 [Pectobacterium wasabiae]
MATGMLIFDHILLWRENIRHPDMLKKPQKFYINNQSYYKVALPFASKANKTKNKSAIFLQWIASTCLFLFSDNTAVARR